MKKLIVVIIGAGLLMSGCSLVESNYPIVKEKAAEQVKKKLADAVANGNLTQKQADKILEGLAKGTEKGEEFYLEKYGKTETTKESESEASKDAGDS